jgi:hypothetical protein
LEAARQKIEQLVSIDENGQIVTKPFDGTASEKIATSARRSRSKKSTSSVVKSTQDSDEDRKQTPSHFEETEDIDDSDGLF